MTAAAPHPHAGALSAAVDRYHDVLAAYVDGGGEDHLALLDRRVKRGAVFAGRPICTLHRPDFVLRSQHTRRVRALRQFRSAIAKAKDVILASPELLEAMALTDGVRRLVEINPKLKRTCFRVMRGSPVGAPRRIQEARGARGAAPRFSSKGAARGGVSTHKGTSL